MSTGITFTDKEEALEALRTYYTEGFNATIKKEGSIYKVYKLDRRKSYKEITPSILREMELEEGMIEPGEYFHLTEKELGKETGLKKKWTHSPVEYISFPGVSFSPTLEQALNALPDAATRFEEGRVMYVYTPRKKKVGFIPLEDDIDVSGEIRIPEDVDVSLVKKIFVKLIKENEDYKWSIEEIEWKKR